MVRVSIISARSLLARCCNSSIVAEGMDNMMYFRAYECSCILELLVPQNECVPSGYIRLCLYPD